MANFHRLCAHSVLTSLFMLVSAALSAQTFWMQNGGGSTIDEGMDVALDGAGNTYATGYFTTAASFGSTTLSSSGVDDVFLAKLGTNGLYVWAVKAGGANSDRALSIKADASGNSYITGYFYGTATFGSNSITSSGAQDAFIAKYDNTGTCVWAKNAGGAGADIGNGITVDNAGNVIVTGEFAGTASFGSTTLTSQNGSTDVFTTKLDAGGNFLWTKQGSAPQTDRGIDVDCDAAGNIYITGQFSDTITFDQVHLNNMLNAVFIVKYDASGSEQWFRKIGGGAMNVANSIAGDGAGGMYLTGDFQGTITFFGATNTTLTATYSNRIFLAKYDLSGNLGWSVAESSDSPLTSRSVSVSGGDCFIGGHFKCTFNSYSDRYAPGLFNSSGFWDVFEGKYSSATGAWSISRQIGGPEDQTCNGIAADASGNPHMVGAYALSVVTPVTNNFYGYPAFLSYNMSVSNNASPNTGLCSDTYYAAFAIAPSAGNSDIYIGNPIDPSRSPYDYYYNTSCAQLFVGVCINRYNGLDYNCGPDTISACQQENLYATTNTGLLALPSPNHVGPYFDYLWSTGQTTPNITVNATGNYSVILTSQDGCYTSEDTIHFILHTPPPRPVISDNVIINTNALNPQPVIICGDSVLLVGGGFTGTAAWYGPQFGSGNYPNDSVMIDSSGLYTFIVTDSNGCISANSVEVTLDDPLLPIDPGMVCLNDSDRNDSMRFCDGEPLFIFPFDSISNPNANLQCIDDLDQILWTISPSSSATILPYTDCINFAYSMTTALVHQTGWYTVTATIIRESACGSDTTIISHSYYCEVLPSPPSTPINLVITGDLSICPGDSNMLVVTGGQNYNWMSGEQDDTLWVSQPGSYTVYCIDTVFNSFGCFTVNSGTASVSVSYTTQPVISLLPSDGVICPGDSVQAVVSGSGNFAWQGPNGPISGNTNTIWITSPGTYYCVVTDPDSCQLLSNTVTIQQYNTPSIQASPSSVLCPGDSVVISLTASSGSSIVWLPPLSGSSLTQVITTPGTYSVTVQACNIATTVSVTITPTAVSAVITPLSATTVCEGDSILLGANPGMDTYNWQPGSSSATTLYVYTSGDYILTTADSGGCAASDTFSVAFTQNQLQPPLVSDTTICRGLPFSLVASGAPTLNWYTAGGTLLATGNVLQLPAGLQSDSTFYVSTNDGVCRSALSPVTVETEECPSLTPNVFTPDGDGVNDNFMLYAPYATGMHVWIYDRWGVLVHEWADLSGYWNGTYMNNGKPVVDGVYYFVAEITDLSGLAYKETGFLHLIRNGGR